MKLMFRDPYFWLVFLFVPPGADHAQFRRDGAQPSNR